MPCLDEFKSFPNPKTNSSMNTKIETTTPIDAGLQKQGVTEEALAKMEAEYSVLTISGIDDKEGYKRVNEARIACKNTRVLTEKFCKAGREDAVKIQKAWIEKEKAIIGRISKTENYLAAQQKAI